MPLPRLIPCLDVAGGRVVKGVKFQGLRDMGDPVELGAAYSEAGADELVFLDIKATLENRGTLVELVGHVAEPLELDALDDAARGDVEARDQARERDRSLTSVRTRSR